MKKDERRLKVGVLGGGTISQAVHFDALARRGISICMPFVTWLTTYETGWQRTGSRRLPIVIINGCWPIHKSSVVECFSTKDRTYRRPLGEDAHTYKLQLEVFAYNVWHAAPMQGANVDDGIAAIRALVVIARSVETGDRVLLSDETGAV